MCHVGLPYSLILTNWFGITALSVILILLADVQCCNFDVEDPSPTSPLGTTAGHHSATEDRLDPRLACGPAPPVTAVQSTSLRKTRVQSTNLRKTQVRSTSLRKTQSMCVHVDALFTILTNRFV